MTAILRRCPFTLLMVAALVVAGIYGKTHVGSLDAGVGRQVGYSVRLLFDGHLHRLITSVFFTAGGWRFYSSLVMLAGSVGWIEFVYGTRRTWLTFFGIHLATLLFLAIGVALPLALLETHRGQLLLDARDVGPSAGYYGCLGLAVAVLSSRKREGVLTGIILVLALRLTWRTIVGLAALPRHQSVRSYPTCNGGSRSGLSFAAGGFDLGQELLHQHLGLF